MSDRTRVTTTWTALAAAALLLTLAVALATYLLVRPQPDRDPAPASRSSAETPEAEAMDGHAHHADESPDAASIVLAQDAVERAGIAATAARAGTLSAALRIPAVVEPNAYKQVVVTSLVAGRVTQVRAQLGDRVRRGETLAAVFSPELADAQREYLSFMADLEAAHHQLRRTERLVDIGAASRQELERVRAEHTAHETHFEGARSRLELLGMSRRAIAALKPGTPISAETHVPAPLTGVVLDRGANPGANVDAAAPLFTIADLSTVWVVGDVYERDLSRVREGSAASMTVRSLPGRTFSGRVAYIDPRVAPETRTAKIRVEIDNPRAELRLGMYADLEIAGSAQAGHAAVLVPRAAVQTIGDRHVIYVADPHQPGRFTEQPVQLGAAVGDEVEVLEGIQAGELVVDKGSFHLRAERERLGGGTGHAHGTVPP